MSSDVLKNLSHVTQQRSQASERKGSVGVECSWTCEVNVVNEKELQPGLSTLKC